MLVLPVGAAVGLSMGTLGAGGSLLAVPALVHLAGLDVHAATTASLVIVLLLALVGLVANSTSGTTDYRTGLVFGVAGTGGTVAGSVLNGVAPDDVLLLGFAALAVAMAVVVSWPSRGPAEPREAACALPTGPLVAVATGVGLLTGLFGVGGGFVVVPALVVFFGLSVRDAARTSLVVIALNALTSLASRAPSLDVPWATVAPFLVAGAVGVIAGTHLARRVRPEGLSASLGAVLVVVAGVVGVPAALGLAGLG